MTSTKLRIIGLLLISVGILALFFFSRWAVEHIDKN